MLLFNLFTVTGRRDILGAAETGSGKTLAFGLPILSGIIKLKEKAAAKGLDVYDIPYKKSSIKKPKNEVVESVKKVRNKKSKKKEVKESSEDGYSSDGENSVDDKVVDISRNQVSLEKDLIEEYDVKLRKREESNDEGNDSDDENYIHLSDMLDSDSDLKSSDDGSENSNEESNEINEENQDAANSNDDESGIDEIDNNEEGKLWIKKMQ